MASPHRPDVLVLGGGGFLGEAWMMGVLSGLEDATGFDLRRCEYFVGTSAGSIVAAHLVAGRSPRRPREIPDRPRPASGDAARSTVRRAGDVAVATAAAFAPLALGLAAPGGALVRGAMLRRLPRPAAPLDQLRSHIASLNARFDGRLRVTAVDRDSGRRVVFGSPGAPAASVATAVAASCTVPWLFAPVSINGREYVDGGVWSPTNMDAAPAGRGTQVLCLNPTASLAGTADLVGVLRRVSRLAAAAEALVLRRRGATVEVVGPDPDCAEQMGINLMDRSRAQAVISAGYAQGLALS
jgi:NTE family protein